LSELYKRLEEIQEIILILGRDNDRLSTNLGSRLITESISEEEGTNRRFYVRAIFAFIEAIVEQHKKLILELAEKRIVTLPKGAYEALSEHIYNVKDNGEIFPQFKYLQLQRKLRAVYKIAGKAFGEPLNINFGGKGWESFQSAIEIRDRLTHPKSKEDCTVENENLDIVESGANWFRGLNKEFVRIAVSHGNTHKWK
jgi:hypothetical protein